MAGIERFPDPPNWRQPDEQLAAVAFLMLDRLGGTFTFNESDLLAFLGKMGGQGALHVECDGDGECTITMHTIGSIAQSAGRKLDA
jgi:hypothetical protein